MGVDWPVMRTGAWQPLPACGLGAATSRQTARLLWLQHNLMVAGSQDHQWKLQGENLNHYSPESFLYFALERQKTEGCVSFTNI